MLRNKPWLPILIVIGALLLSALVVLANSAGIITINVPNSVSEPPAQNVENSFELLGCVDNICAYLIDVPYGVDCVVAIQTFVIDPNVFDLECPGS